MMHSKHISENCAALSCVNFEIVIVDDNNLVGIAPVANVINSQ